MNSTLHTTTQTAKLPTTQTAKLPTTQTTKLPTTQTTKHNYTHYPKQPSTHPYTQKTKFKFKRKNNTQPKRFAIKRKTLNHYQLFVKFCRLHQLSFFQFYDSNNWIGPAIKLKHPHIELVYSLLETQPFDTISLGGFGFDIIRPSQHLQDNTIYPQSNYQLLSFTHQPIIPYHSDSDDFNQSQSDSDDSIDIHSEQELSLDSHFVAEEWIYNTTKFLLDSSTNYLYCPNTLQYLGKKTGQFSIDYHHKE